MSVYYPRRTDSVVAITYNDSESVEAIYDALGGPDITITVKPRQADIMTVLGFVVEQGMVVVINPRTRKVFEILDSWDFATAYSKDGL